MAGAAALALPQSYYDSLREHYARGRDILLGYLRQAGFEFQAPEGAYYVMTDIASFAHGLGRHAVRALDDRKRGRLGRAGQQFLCPARARGQTKVRFMFAKRDETLHAAGERLLKLRERLPTVSRGKGRCVPCRRPSTPP